MGSNSVKRRNTGRKHTINNSLGDTFYFNIYQSTPAHQPIKPELQIIIIPFHTHQKNFTIIAKFHHHCHNSIMNILMLCVAALSGLILVSVLLVIFWFIKKRGRSRKFVFEDVGMIPKEPPVPYKTENHCSDSHSSSNLVTRKAPSIPQTPHESEPLDRQRQIEEIKDEFFGGIYASIESLGESSEEESSEQDESVKNNNNSSKPETAAQKSTKKVIIKRPAPDVPKVTLKPPRRSTSITKINPNIPQRTTSMKTKH